MSSSYGHTMLITRTIEINVHLGITPTEDHVEIIGAFDAETSEPIKLTTSEANAIYDNALTDFQDTIESLDLEETFDRWKHERTHGDQ
jgi:hypothetical protein